MLKVGNPTPLFFDARGLLLDGGYIYIGVANGDPETSPIPVYSDPGLTVALAQPIRTVGGMAVNGVTPVQIFVSGTDYSERVKDSTGALVSYSPSVYVVSSSFQPASSTLDALAALSTTTFGRSLLTLANLTALQTLLGGLGYLPLVGGTMTGETTHQGAGVETYWNDATMTSGKQFFTDSTGTDPTTAAGQIWLKGVV